MTNEKLKSTLRFYYDALTSLDQPFCGRFIKEFPVTAKQLDETEYGYNYIDVGSLAAHLAWMCRRCLDAFILEGPGQDIGKAHRWLGYSQGELRAAQVSTISELRDHSRN